jgi:hypothetical protein
MTALVARGHALGLTVEWYMNGCGCVGPDHNPGARQNYEGDVAAIRAHGFDGVKFVSTPLFQTTFVVPHLLLWLLCMQYQSGRWIALRTGRVPVDRTAAAATRT